MTRVVVHIGSQRIASMAIPRGLFANLDVFAERGVLVPKVARHELSPLAVRHHLLAWSLDPGGEHPYDPNVWDSLAEEIASSQAHTVLISSEMLAGVAVNESTRGPLRERLRSLSDDVTLAFIARDQLGLLNSLYTQRVRSLELTCDFPTYLAETPDLAFCRLAESFEPWYDDPEIRFVAMPWDAEQDSEALPALMSLCGIDVAAEELLPVANTEREELGPVGVEATRILGGYLRGRFPDFSFGESAARRLRRRAAAMAEAYGWCTGDFWGWDPAQAAAAEAAYEASNREFARRSWGGEWAVTAPLDRARNVVDISDVSPTDANRLHHYVNETADTFERLRAKEPVT